MFGPAGLFTGVRIDRCQPPNSLTGAAAQFHISPREVQVLALLLDGNHLDQIAQQLYITSSTVQDYIKSMLDKTRSHNRSELIARVLGWKSTPPASPTMRVQSFARVQHSDLTEAGWPGAPAVRGQSPAPTSALARRARRLRFWRPETGSRVRKVAAGRE